MAEQHSATERYIGRFAPSPSGPLHLGSLVCALASWLDARSNGGSWLVRIEDLDPPREQPGADQLILDCLYAHHLHWDGDIIYQSQRHNRYRKILAELKQRQLCYPCCCTRARLKTLAGRYDRHCWTTPPAAETPSAIRLHLGNALQALNLAPDAEDYFEDGILGPRQQQLTDLDDIIIHRKDGLFAYQLAVTVDDWAQGITHVVRGADLLNTTTYQRLLFQLFGALPPSYSHIPLITDSNGNKLSKQNHAPAVDTQTPAHNLLIACELLGLPMETLNKKRNCTEILSRATQLWAKPNFGPDTKFSTKLRD